MTDVPKWVQEDKEKFGNSYGKGGSEVISSTSLARLGGTNFFNMRDASQLNSVVASAPPFHQNVTRALIASGKVMPKDPIVERAILQTMPATRTIRAATPRLVFTRGTPVVHTPTGKKLTVIQASVGHTKKTLTPVHRVADKRGNSWDIKETELQPRLRT